MGFVVEDDLEVDFVVFDLVALGAADSELGDFVFGNYVELFFGCKVEFLNFEFGVEIEKGAFDEVGVWIFWGRFGSVQVQNCELLVKLFFFRKIEEGRG